MDTILLLGPSQSWFVGCCKALSLDKTHYVMDKTQFVIGQNTICHWTKQFDIGQKHNEVCPLKKILLYTWPSLYTGVCTFMYKIIVECTMWLVSLFD